jgi:branched-chain amino acid transport system substrate-binding protein
MENKNKYILIALALVLVLLALNFVYFTGNSVKNINKEIRIGAILPLTGPASSIGLTLKQGLEWKVDELNSQGHNIKLYIEDSQSDPKQAVTSFQKLTSTDNIDIVFTISSASAMALKPLAEQQKVLLWGDVSHPQFTENASYVLRHSNIADNDAKVLSMAMLKKDLKRVSILYQSDDWGLAMEKELRKYLQTFDVIVNSQAINNKDSDFKTQLNKVKEDDANAVVFCAIGPAAGLLIKQAKELGIGGEIYSSVGLIFTPAAVEASKSYLPGTYYETTKSNALFERAFREKFNKNPELMSYIGYTDIELLVYAMEKTHSQDPKIIVNFIKKLGTFKGKYETAEISVRGDIIISTEVKQW